MKKIIGWVLLISSLTFLVLGLTFPFMTFKIEVKMEGGGFLGNLIGGSIAEKFNQTTTYNIPQAMRMLFEKRQYFVGILIGLFAVVLPITKTILTFIFLITKNARLYKLIGAIAKFAMADVFCVGIFIAFLYTQFIKSLNVDIEMGYYFFASYVILNIISVILLKQSDKKV